MNHDARIIPIGVRRQPSRARPWFGESIGRWHGGTLVIETINLHPVQVEQISDFWAYGAASERLKVTEWLTRTGPDTIHYRFTIEDPETYTAPFTGELPFRRMDEMIYEYACHEGNRSLANILSVARSTEQ